VIAQFKSGAVVPKGVTADGVLAERDRIAQAFGHASVELATKAVMGDPEKYPNLRAFGPRNAEEALEHGISDGIRYAFRNVIRVKVTKHEPEMRKLQLVTTDAGVQSYERFEVVARTPPYRRQVLRRLAREAQNAANRQRDTLAELELLDSEEDDSPEDDSPE
jgi:hypothetical protein